MIRNDDKSKQGCIEDAFSWLKKNSQVEKLVWDSAGSRIKLDADRFEEIATQKVT